jgi:hypothetical protein
MEGWKHGSQEKNGTTQRPSLPLIDEHRRKWPFSTVCSEIDEFPLDSPGAERR